jgi:hypothetical protein
MKLKLLSICFVILCCLSFLGGKVDTGTIIINTIDINDIEQLAEQENVYIFYIEHSEMYKYQEIFQIPFEVAGVYFANGIYIDLKYNTIETLAHELGHHYAIKFEDNYSEERANELRNDLMKYGYYVSLRV